MTQAKVEQLTAEQAAELPRFHARWLAHGLSASRADRPRAEAAIMAMRKEVGVKNKKPVFIWVQSPATGVLALNVLRSEQWKKVVAGQGASLRDSLWASLWASLRDSLWASLRDSLWASLGASLRDSLWDSLWASLGDSLRDSLGASLWASLGASLGDSLWASLGDSLRDSLRDSLGASLRDSLGASLGDSLRDSLRDSLGDSLWASLGDSLRDSLRDSLWASLRDSLGASLGASLGDSLRDSLRDSLWADLAHNWWGQHDSYWVAFYVFCRDVVGVKYDEKRSRQLDMWADIAQSCCWWWAYENYVIVCERPTIATLDDRGRLHGQNGPALAFADGWQVHSWHGTRVPAEWIEKPKDVDAKLALTWENVEQRRALAEIVGWAKVLEHVNARVVDTDTADIGTLLEADLPGSEGTRFLKVLCGTGRSFVLCVPATCQTAREANAWGYGLEASELRPELRT